VRLLQLALVTPEAREAYGSAEFPGLGLLLLSESERTLEVRLRFRCIRRWRQPRYRVLKDGGSPRPAAED